MITSDEAKLGLIYEGRGVRQKPQADRNAEFNEYLFKLLSPSEQEVHPVIPGLEGPMRMKSGKIAYYDAREGKMYDNRTDMYMSYDEYDAHNNSDAKRDSDD